jgi:tetratricopeptide (TPR) repeat protein
MAATIDSAGIDASITRYRSLRQAIPARYNFREEELNRLGYDLLRKKQIAEAIAVFQLNADQFPSSFNVFDSLGDGYVAASRDSEAIACDQRSLALFPDKANYSGPKLARLQRNAH